MWPIIIVILCLLVWIGIAVGIAYLIPLAGSMFWIFIGIMSLVGIIGAGVYLLAPFQAARPPRRK